MGGKPPRDTIPGYGHPEPDRAALRVFLVSYVVFALTTWFVYIRRSSPFGDAAI